MLFGGNHSLLIDLLVYPMFSEQNTVAKFSVCNLGFGARHNVARKDASLNRLAAGIRLEGDTPQMDLMTSLLSTEEGPIQGRLLSLQGVSLSEATTFHKRGRHRVGLPMLGIAAEDPASPLRVHVIFCDLDESKYRDLHPFRQVGSEEIFASESYAYQMLSSLSDVNLEAVRTVAEIRYADGNWRRVDCLLVEDFSRAASNRNGQLYQRGDPSFEAADIFNYFLFQCLVGNSDYQLDFSDRGRLQLHNTLLISCQGREIPIPYDFQYVCTVAPEYWRFGPGGEKKIAQRNAAMLSQAMETMPQVDFSFCFDAIDFAIGFLDRVEMPQTIRIRYKSYLNALGHELKL
jgi:hypothetical protein